MWTDGREIRQTCAVGDATPVILCGQRWSATCDTPAIERTTQPDKVLPSGHGQKGGSGMAAIWYSAGMDSVNAVWHAGGDLRTRGSGRPLNGHV